MNARKEGLDKNVAAQFWTNYWKDKTPGKKDD